ncbi:C6 zinc finger domain-containing protein [Colletotrichum tofieldiae]|nr:C6 zinc finger domain-containing protein [Colletotrichum tofieldiae]
MVPKPLQVDSELVSLKQFYSNYASAGQVALFSLLPSLKSSASTSVVFEEALKATAMASSSVQMRQTGLMVRARQHYGSAVTKIGAALQNPATAQDDSVVVGLLTLGIYEVNRPKPHPVIGDARLGKSVGLGDANAITGTRARRNT